MVSLKYRHQGFPNSEKKQDYKKKLSAALSCGAVYYAVPCKVFYNHLDESYRAVLPVVLYIM